MKKNIFLLFTIFLLNGIRVQADEGDHEVVFSISDQLVDIQANLNADTVLCLRGDYSATSFKIAIPEIKFYTHLDHTSPGAPGPCINAGRCNSKGEKGTDDRLPIFRDNSHPKEDIKLRVVLEEVLELHEFSRTCSRVYRERLSSMIRGVPFYHEVSLQLAPLEYETCAVLAGTKLN